MSPHLHIRHMKNIKPTHLSLPLPSLAPRRRPFLESKHRKRRSQSCETNLLRSFAGVSRRGLCESTPVSASLSLSLFPSLFCFCFCGRGGGRGGGRGRAGAGPEERQKQRRTVSSPSGRTGFKPPRAGAGQRRGRSSEGQSRARPAGRASSLPGAEERQKQRSHSLSPFQHLA